jgi:GR25 family glycosyltransferase involved in LPS biosynthesis
MNYKILVVNLKHRLDRKEYIIELFKLYNIENYEFFEAIYGKQLENSLELKKIFKNNDFGNRKGFIGCAMSHYQIWLKLVHDKNIDFYIIFEDDVKLSKHFHKYFEHLKNFTYNNLEKIDLLFLGYTSYHNQEYIQKYEEKDIELKHSIHELNKNHYLGGFFSYIVTKYGAQNQLNYIEKNGIKHGIDYLHKINNDLNCFHVFPHLAYSDWIRTTEGDTNIQNDYDTFDFNKIIDNYNHFFIPTMDIMNYDVIKYDNYSIDNLINISNISNNINGFNTLGFMKSKINIDKLEKSKYFNINDGIYIKYDHFIYVQLNSNIDPSYFFYNGIWKNIKIIFNNSIEPDYYVIFNENDNISCNIEKTILFDNNQHNISNKYLDIINHEHFLFYDFENKIKKYNDLATLYSNNQLKKDFLNYIQINYPDFHIFNVEYNKYEHYKYYLIIEDNQCNTNDIFWKPFLSNCVCFYYGSMNLEKYNNAFIRLDLSNFEKSYQLIKNVIFNDLYSTISSIIDKEKYILLNYYHFYPSIERLITKNIFKNTLNKFNIQIIFLGNHYKNVPLYKSLLDLGFNIHFMNKPNNIESFINIYNDLNNNYNINNIDNYLFIDDETEYNCSLKKIIYHIEILVPNYDIIYIDNDNNFKNKYKLKNIHNSFFYSIINTYFQNKNDHFISKQGLKKIILHYENVIKINNMNESFYHFIKNIQDFNFYICSLT